MKKIKVIWGSIPPSHLWVYLHLKIEENIIENGDGERTLLGLQRNAVSIIMIQVEVFYTMRRSSL